MQTGKQWRKWSNGPRIYCLSYKPHSRREHIARVKSGAYGFQNQGAGKEAWEFRTWWTGGFNRSCCKSWTIFEPTFHPSSHGFRPNRGTP